MIESGKTGYLVPKGSAEFLAKRIVELLQDPSKAAESALNGRKMVHERFPAEKMIKATESSLRRGAHPGGFPSASVIFRR